MECARPHSGKPLWAMFSPQYYLIGGAIMFANWKNRRGRAEFLQPLHGHARPEPKLLQPLRGRFHERPASL